MIVASSVACREVPLSAQVSSMSGHVLGAVNDTCCF